MDALLAKFGRSYTPLPIDSTAGFPQSFPFLFNGTIYHFLLYVNIAADLLNEKTTFIPVPSEAAFLVVQVEREVVDGTRETIFLRKVVPELEYQAENIALTFPQQQIARNNLNGQGEFGSKVIGGIAQR